MSALISTTVKHRNDFLLLHGQSVLNWEKIQAVKNLMKNFQMRHWSGKGERGAAQLEWSQDARIMTGSKSSHFKCNWVIFCKQLDNKEISIKWWQKNLFNKKLQFNIIKCPFLTNQFEMETVVLAKIQGVGFCSHSPCCMIMTQPEAFDP